LEGQVLVGDEGRSRKPQVTLKRKITWSATAEGDGGLIVGKAARGAIPDQVGRLEV
jgi:hypothetical protein